MNNSFSRYRNIKSFVHSIDPITKLIAFMLLTIAMFLAQSLISLSVIAIFVLFVSFLARVRIRSYFLTLLLVIPFFVIMTIIYAAIPPYDNFDIMMIKIATMTLRLYLFIFIAIIYTSTTKEMEIANSIEWLITPLKYIKVPIYEISIMIMLAIRFIPILFEDVIKIMIAQTSRGVNVINGNFRTRIKGVFNSMLPLFFVAFKRSDDIAKVMSIRGYKIGHKRSKYYKTKFCIREWVTLLVMVGLIVVVELINTGVIF